MIIGRDIVKDFGTKRVLDGVDVQVGPGEVCALMGPNGCGKSTLLRALALLDPPTSGEVQIDERTYRYPDTGDNGLSAPWPELTFVFQQIFLWPHLTVRDNILLPVQGRDDVDDTYLAELIETFDLAEFIDRFPNQVSLGQRQRAGLVRALALRPKYLLLDEVTSALDVEQVTLVLEQINLLRSRGAGVMLVTHMVGFARRVADQVVFIDDGKVIESGGPDVLTDPSTERVAHFLSLIGTR